MAKKIHGVIITIDHDDFYVSRGSAYFDLIKRMGSILDNHLEEIFKSAIFMIVNKPKEKEIENTKVSMTEFLPMVFSTLLENGVIILAHDTNVSDAIKFRAKFGNILRLGSRDCTEEIASAFNQATLNSIATNYESCLKFPALTEEDWQKLKQIKQADYTNDYSTFSNEFQTVKNLIDFVISDKLEAFSNIERNQIIDKFRDYLIENNYQLKSTCKIQVALSPRHTLECENQFLQLKEKIECQNSIKVTTPLSLSYSGTLYSNKQNTVTTQTQEEKPRIGFGFTGAI